MQMDHDVTYKIITISQPGYVDTLSVSFHVDQNFSKSPSKILFSHYNVTDDNPISLSKQDQSLFIKIVGSLLFLISHFTSIIFPCS